MLLLIDASCRLLLLFVSSHRFARLTRFARSRAALVAPKLQCSCIFVDFYIFCEVRAISTYLCVFAPICVYLHVFDAQIRPDIPRYHRYTQIRPDTPISTRYTQIHPGAPRYTQIRPEVPRCTQMRPDTPSQLCPDAPRDAQICRNTARNA